MFTPAHRPGRGLGPVAAVVVSIAGLSVAADGAFAQCEPVWSEGFECAITEVGIGDAVVFDYGEGPKLIVGGGFRTISGQHIEGIAMWDGQAWVPIAAELVPGSSNLNVYCLRVLDDGNGSAMFASGHFVVPGPVECANVARWDGFQWTGLGSGVSGGVWAMDMFDPDGAGPEPVSLYVAGSVTSAGGLPVQNIARFDGEQWHALGAGADGLILSQAVYDDGRGAALYIAGFFETVDGVPAMGMARFDGENWSAVPGGPAYGADAMAVFDPDGAGPARELLILGGSFVGVGGAEARGIVAWDGANWIDLGEGFTGWWTNRVDTLTVWDYGRGARLFAGGTFLRSGDVELNRIAEWDGTSWRALGSGVRLGISGYGTNVYAMVGYASSEGNVLVAAGNFAFAGDVGPDRIAKWNGEEWRAFPSTDGQGPDTTVHALAVHDDGTGPALFVGGYFAAVGTVGANRIARWDGHAWFALGQDFTYYADNVHVLCPFDDALIPGRKTLYAAGQFRPDPTTDSYALARFNGSSWEFIPGPHHSVYALAAFDDGAGEALFVGGGFNDVNGMTPGRLAKWTGTEWESLPTTPNGTIYRLCVCDEDGPGAGTPSLFVGGSFTSVGGQPMKNIARWDGTAWSALGAGVNDRPWAMAVFDDRVGGGPALYVGGWFTMAGGVPASHIARWTGNAWQTLGAGLVFPPTGIAVYDTDGDGPRPAALYVAGSDPGGPSTHLATWTGTDWAEIGTDPFGESAWFNGTAVFDDDGDGPLPPALYFGGHFYETNGHPSQHFARYGPICAPCAGDLSGDRVIDGADLNVLLADFGCISGGGPGNCPGDLDADGDTDSTDLNVMLSTFGTACP